jgi:nicotinate-nucleotide adenylyltransferase
LIPHPLCGPSFAGRRVGLLGGSFNPAHDGHLSISREALRRLQLDEVWWLVSPQNPLKSARGMLPLAERMARAQAVTKADPRLRVTALETALGTRYTADTLQALRRHFVGTHFVWLMGADNLMQMSRWQHWTRILEAVPIAILARAPYSLRSLSAKTAKRYRHCRLPASGARLFATQIAPAWTFIVIPLHPASATAIRAQWAGAAGTPQTSAASKEQVIVVP